MKDAVKIYYMYSITGTAAWFILGTLGLLRDKPDDSWLQDLTTILLTGIPAVVVRHLLFKNPPNQNPTPTK